jgi:hypothetical protein
MRRMTLPCRLQANPVMNSFFLLQSTKPIDDVSVQLSVFSSRGNYFYPSFFVIYSFSHDGRVVLKSLGDVDSAGTITTLAAQSLLRLHKLKHVG